MIQVDARVNDGDAKPNAPGPHVPSRRYAHVRTRCAGISVDGLAGVLQTPKKGEAWVVGHSRGVDDKIRLGIQHVRVGAIRSQSLLHRA